MNYFCLHKSEETEIWLYNEQIFIKHLLQVIYLGDGTFPWEMVENLIFYYNSKGLL